MTNDITGRPSVKTWLRELLRGPVRPFGDYFELLATRVEASAPLCARVC